jgi:hypothetical protein
MIKERRKGKIGKALSLLLVISLLGLSQNLIAGERHGAMLSVQKKDGHQDNGELIAVKPSSLLLLDSASEADISIEVSDISAIKVVKKSRAWIGLGLGALIGAGIGALLGVANVVDPGRIGGKRVLWRSRGQKAVVIGAFFAVPSGLLGLGIGAAAGTDKKIQFEGKSDLEIQSALGELRQKARIPDFK